MAQKFPYEKAALCLAEAEIFGDQQVLKKYNISRQTLYRWRERSLRDGELSQTVILRVRMLLVEWQQDATKTIKISLEELNRRIPLAATEEDAKVIQAISSVCKVLGDLRITSDALSKNNEQSIVAYQGPKAAAAQGSQQW